MNKEESAIIDAATAWWKSRRPSEFSLIDHLQAPRINTVDQAERNLASAVAKYQHATRGRK